MSMFSIFVVCFRVLHPFEDAQIMAMVVVRPFLSPGQPTLSLSMERKFPRPHTGGTLVPCTWTRTSSELQPGTAEWLPVEAAEALPRSQEVGCRRQN